MGCAFISQKESIKSKELDLHLENILLYYKETNDSINARQKFNDEIFEVKNTNYKNLQKITIDKEINDKKANSNKNNKKGVYVSGPIISMLKRQVDNYTKIKNN